MSTRRFLAALAAAGIAATAGPTRGDAPPALPGPAPRGRAGVDVAAADAACAACHADIAREWTGSLHRQSFRDPVFLAAYALEPLAFCRRCHAPEADPARAPDEAARAEGVGCVTCHVEEGAVLGPRAAPRAPHAVTADARLAGDRACGGCHAFAFPDGPSPMQDTVREHAESPEAARSCASCHMPVSRDARGRRHTRHDFTVRTAAILGGAVGVRASWSGPGAVELALHATGAGHAVPTGDPFRRLELRAEAVDLDGRVVARAAPVALARAFALQPTAPGMSRRVPIGDARLPASGADRAAVLIFPRPVAAHAVRWSVAYQRMEPGVASLYGLDPRADEIVIATGTLPAGAAP